MLSSGRWHEFKLRNELQCQSDMLLYSETIVPSVIKRTHFYGQKPSLLKGKPFKLNSKGRLSCQVGKIIVFNQSSA